MLDNNDLEYINQIVQDALERKLENIEDNLDVLSTLVDELSTDLKSESGYKLNSSL